MVAYSFKRQFVFPIEQGTKVQTIRSQRRRHARVGEELQLYQGMRTRQCRLIARKTCTAVLAAELIVEPAGIVEAWVGRRPVEDLDAFAVQDGFRDAAEMAAFWQAMHGCGAFVDLVLIAWRPMMAAD